MIRKIIAVLLVVSCAVGLFAGCGAIGDVADEVLAAAKTELENQIKAKVEEYKVEVVETKTVVGQLNDAGKYQFCCALLVQTNTEGSAEDCAKALGKLFGETGTLKQSGSEVKLDKLVHKTITYDHADFEEGNYYTVYVYVEDVTKVIDLNKDSTENT